MKEDGSYEHIFIFSLHILNISIQGTNSIGILFYNLPLSKLKGP